MGRFGVMSLPQERENISLLYTDPPCTASASEAGHKATLLAGHEGNWFGSGREKKTVVVDEMTEGIGETTGDVDGMEEGKK